SHQYEHDHQHDRPHYEGRRVLLYTPGLELAQTRPGGVGYGRQTVDDPVDAALVDAAIDEPGEMVDHSADPIDDAVDDVGVGPVREPGERAHREPGDAHGQVVHVVLAAEQRVEHGDL